jgi:hypothetical protein
MNVSRGGRGGVRVESVVQMTESRLVRLRRGHGPARQGHQEHEESKRSAHAG